MYNVSINEFMTGGAWVEYQDHKDDGATIKPTYQKLFDDVETARKWVIDNGGIL